MTRHAVETKTAEVAHRSGCPSGLYLGIAPAHHRQIVRIGGISFANTTCQINNLDKAAFPCTRIMTTKPGTGDYDFLSCAVPGHIADRRWHLTSPPHSGLLLRSNRPAFSLFNKAS